MAKIFDVVGNLLHEDNKLSYEMTVRGAIDKGINMRFAQLSQKTLKGLDLSYGKLTGACFVSSNLSKADCKDVDLSGADFACANLKGADIRWGNLRGANLSGADFSDADLFKADLRGANLTNAKFTGARMDEANLDNARVYVSSYDFKVDSPNIYEEAKIELWAHLGFRIEKISWKKLWASGELWEHILVLKKKTGGEENNG